MEKQLILILGGARSGKSAYAQQLALELGGDSVVYVATAEGRDNEMRARILAHRAGRPGTWHTLEATQEVGRQVAATVGDTRVAIVDCLTLLVSNVILALGDDPGVGEAEEAALIEVAGLLDAYDAGKATWILVSNEVGLGLVPVHALGRAYRDALGRANQRVAAAADRVLFMIAGLPMPLK